MFKWAYKLALLGILISSNAFADSDWSACPSYSADSTISHFNACRSASVSWSAGQVQGSGTTGSTANIKTDSLGELDMADEINPRVRDSELLNITYDTFSGGTLTQGAIVESGCVPATSAGLSSDISACVAYVNGYRVSKSATSQTYTNNMDTYVDLSQSGVYTLSAVASGATQPTVASNSVRLAKVVTSGGAITTVTTLYTSRIPGLIIPANYRDGLYVSRDSATTISIFPGSAEVNNSIIQKTSTSSLSISTAGDWAGGSSLAAADTFGFVGIDASGNLKLHTTAPAFSDYSVSNTAGKKRYSTWSSTVYRILGWFYMSTSTVIDGASNIKEHGLSNTVVSNDTNQSAISSTSYVNIAAAKIYTSGGPVGHYFSISGDAAASFNRFDTSVFNDSSQIVASEKSTNLVGGAGVNSTVTNVYLEGDTANPSQGVKRYYIRCKVNSDSLNRKRSTYFVTEE